MAYYNGKQIVGFKINQINKQMDIDQQFKPQSPNAQSGTAVKQAVDEAMESMYDNIGNINASNAESVSITNQDTPLTFWLGSENEYNSLESKESNCLHIITDDDNTEKIENDIQKINERIDNMVDYIVEQGTSGQWSYRKWNSGFAECWGCQTQIVNINNSWGNSSNNVLYVSSIGVTEEVKFPFEFTEDPHIVCSVNSSDANDGYSVILLSTNATDVNKDRFKMPQVACPIQATGITITFNFEVKGYLKEV